MPSRSPWWLASFVLVLSLAACPAEEAADAADAAAAPTAGAPGTAPAAAPEAAKPAGAEPAAAAPAAKPLRRFVEVTGGVTLDGQPAAVDAEIPDKATIVTAKDGHAVISLHKGGVIEIRSDTKVEVGTSERKAVSLKMLAGAIWSFLPKGVSYEVTTQNAVAGVRGTVFYMEARGPKKSYLCACDGEIELLGADTKLSKAITSKMEHKAFAIDSKGKKQVAKKAKRERHTDAEKDAMLVLMKGAE